VQRSIGLAGAAETRDVRARRGMVKYMMAFGGLVRGRADDTGGDRSAFG